MKIGSGHEYDDLYYLDDHILHSGLAIISSSNTHYNGIISWIGSQSELRVTVPPARYDCEDEHVSIALVIETGDPSRYRELIEANDLGRWITAMKQEMEPLDRNQPRSLIIAYQC